MGSQDVDRVVLTGDAIKLNEPRGATRRAQEMRHFAGAVLCGCWVVAGPAAGQDDALPAPGIGGQDSKTLLLRDAELRDALADDDPYAPKFDGRMQFRYIYSHRERPEPNDASGFVFRRVRLGVSGDLNDWLSYNGEFSVDRGDGSASISDASVGIGLGGGFLLLVGQFRPAFLREEVVSSSKQLLVERSLVTLAFAQPRNTGIQTAYQGDRWRLTAAVMDRGGEPGGDERWAVLGRAEARLAGEWKSFRDFTGDREQSLGILVGAAVMHDRSDTLDPDEPDPEFVRWTADVTIEHGGASLFAAVIGNRLDRGEFSGEQDQYGAIIQGGFHLTDTWELVGRYEWGSADSAAKSLNVVSGGVNHYIAGHAVKWSTDVGYGLNEVNGFWSSTGAGWLTDGSGHDGQIVLRTQLQIVF